MITFIKEFFIIVQEAHIIRSCVHYESNVHQLLINRDYILT